MIQNDLPGGAAATGPGDDGLRGLSSSLKDSTRGATGGLEIELEVEVGLSKGRVSLREGADRSSEARDGKFGSRD